MKYSLLMKKAELFVGFLRIVAAFVTWVLSIRKLRDIYYFHAYLELMRMTKGENVLLNKAVMLGVLALIVAILVPIIWNESGETSASQVYGPHQNASPNSTTRTFALLIPAFAALGAVVWIVKQIV